MVYDGGEDEEASKEEEDRKVGRREGGRARTQAKETHRVLRDSVQKNLKPTPPCLYKFRAKSADDKLFWDRRDDNAGVLLHELAVEPNEVAEAPDDGKLHDIGAASFRYLGYYLVADVCVHALALLDLRGGMHR